MNMEVSEDLYITAVFSLHFYIKQYPAIHGRHTPSSPPSTNPAIQIMSPKNHRKGAGQEYHIKERYDSERPSSFNGRDGGVVVSEVFPGPRTVPDFLAGKRVIEGVASKRTPPPKLTKLLMKVTIERSLGPVQVVMSPEGSVKDLIDAALLLYVKEGRRPLLPSTAVADFELHYSQFALESLKGEEKLMTLGSRNFFLCQKMAAAAAAVGSGGAPSTSSCWRAAKKQGLPCSNSWISIFN